MFDYKNEINKIQFHQQANSQGVLTSWVATTRFMFTGGSLKRKIIFETKKINGIITTNCHVESPILTNREFKSVICTHLMKQPTYEIIKDSHKAAMLDFDYHIKLAKEFYYDSPYTTRIKKLSEMHNFENYMQAL